MALKQFDSLLWEKHGGEVGDWAFTDDGTYIIVRLPDDAAADQDLPNIAALRIKPYADGEDWAGSEAVWNWNGSKDAPTLTPSILHHSVPEWHGYLTAGKLVTL